MRKLLIVGVLLGFVLGGLPEAEAGKRGGASRASSGRVKGTRVKGHVRHTRGKGQAPRWVPGHQRSKGQ